MGTRACYGFVKGEEFKLTYNHFDGYIEGLGFKLKEELRNFTLGEMREAFDYIKMIKDDSDIVPDDILEKLVNKKYVKSKSKCMEWYWALREYQGSIKPFLEWDIDCRYMTDGTNYKDYEYMYVIDLNNGTFISKKIDYNENESLFHFKKGIKKYDNFIKKLKERNKAFIIDLDKLNSISNDEYLSLYNKREKESEIING